ncbi:HigA protein [Halorhodospira halochloris]|uniref:HigA protein n=2 Tax=Halorhodospira halochloris TaxID=1052 RepID=A0A110B775_HALHR|nr:HigA protein [Halorhodospira halochloris]
MHKPAGAIHPGEILLEQFLEPAGIDGQRLADEIGLPAEDIAEIFAGTRSICADTALRLARFLGTAPELWLHLQNQYDLEITAASIETELMAIEPANGASENYPGTI